MAFWESRIICPASGAAGLDNWVRRKLQNPREIFTPFVREGMTVLEVGCGPGFFTPDIARLAGRSGRVVAADVQQAMLDKLGAKIRKIRDRDESDPATRIELRLAGKDSLNLPDLAGAADLISVFWMAHEVPDHPAFFRELRTLQKPGGRLLVVEPKFHVSGASFAAMEAVILALGWRVAERPVISFSRSLLLA